MGFEPVRSDRGQPRYVCACDDCGREEIVPAKHGRDGKDGLGQAAAKIQRLGWSYIGKHLRCGACEAKRKVEKVAVKTGQQVVAQSAPREPTRAQKREIMSLLGEVYQEDNQRYSGGETDDTVAGVLGVMPGWVAAIREEFFGPDGGNEQIEELSSEIRKFMDEVRSRRDAAAQVVKSCDAALDRVASMEKTLEQIKKAVGPRNLVRVK